VLSISFHSFFRKILVIGWDSGDLYLYVEDTCLRVDTSHSSSIHLAEWSYPRSGGGGSGSGSALLVTADRDGSVVGWRSDGASGLDMVFHHELKDALTSMAFPPPPSSALDRSSSDDVSLTGLARAAVAGDERALDLFSSWRPPPVATRLAGNSNNAYAGSAKGVVYCLSENGSCREVLQADGAVKRLRLAGGGSELIVVTENMVIGQFAVESDGSVKESSRVKLSTRSKENHLTWLGEDHLAVSGGDLTVRVWNLKTDQNFVLSAPNVAGGPAGGQQFLTSLAYAPLKHVVAAGANSGAVYMWKCLEESAFSEETSWRALPATSVGAAVRSVAWGAEGNVCSVNTVRQVFFLHEQKRAASFLKGLTAAQVSPTTVEIGLTDPKSAPIRLSANVSVEEVHLAEGSLVVYGSGRVMVYEVQEELRHTLFVGNFDLFCDAVDAYEASVCTLEGNRVNVRSHQGTIKQTLALNEVEGQGETLEVVGGRYVVVVTANRFVKIWDVSKREARLHAHPINLPERIPNLLPAVKEAKLNASGTRLSVIAAASANSCDSRVYVLDLEGNRVSYFNFDSGKGDRDDASVGEEKYRCSHYYG